VKLVEAEVRWDAGKLIERRSGAPQGRENANGAR
jgi:hypothetical protein